MRASQRARPAARLRLGCLSVAVLAWLSIAVAAVIALHRESTSAFDVMLIAVLLVVSPIGSWIEALLAGPSRR